jgi:hypothetical protein
MAITPCPRSASRRGRLRTSEGIELVTVRDFDSGAFDQCMRTRGYAQVPVRRPA